MQEDTYVRNNLWKGYFKEFGPAFVLILWNTSHSLSVCDSVAELRTKHFWEGGYGGLIDAVSEAVINWDNGPHEVDRFVITVIVASGN